MISHWLLFKTLGCGTESRLWFNWAHAATCWRHGGRPELARVVPHVIPQRVVIRIEAEPICFIERLFDAPVAMRDSIDRGHLADAVEPIRTEDEEWSSCGVGNQRNEPIGFLVGGRIPDARWHPFVTKTGCLRRVLHVIRVVVNRAKIDQRRDAEPGKRPDPDAQGLRAAYVVLVHPVKQRHGSCYFSGCVLEPRFTTTPGWSLVWRVVAEDDC